MLAFLVQRISQAFLVMFVISVIAFAIQDGLGDPLQELVGMSVSADERDAIREEMGLNDSILVQYARFAGNALQGDLGVSYFYGKPTLEVISEHLPATLELVIGSSLIIMLLSVPAEGDLEPARKAFLALALHSAGRSDEALREAIEGIIPTLPRYQRSLAGYAEALTGAHLE